MTSCSRPDWANPCEHVAAVHDVLATRLDDEPFLFVEQAVTRTADLAWDVPHEQHGEAGGSDRAGQT